MEETETGQDKETEGRRERAGDGESRRRLTLLKLIPNYHRDT